MTKYSAFIATSQDGYIADKDGFIEVDVIDYGDITSFVCVRK